MDDEQTDYHRNGGTDDTSGQIRRVLGGDDAALDWLVDWLSPLMLSWARSQLRSGIALPLAAEDLVQDVWVRILPNITQLEPHPDSPGRVTPALLAIVRTTLRNRVIDVRRAAARSRVQAARSPEGSTLHLANGSSGPFVKLIRSERRRLLEDALARLNERERALYVNRVFEEAGIDDLAAEFGMSRAAVIKARQRVRQRLAKHLEPQFLDDLEPGSHGADS